MSKMVKAVSENRKSQVSKVVKNFMGGNSYVYSPIETLKMVTASSIFGEPAYYRAGEFADATYRVNELFEEYSILDKSFVGEKTSDIMEKVIDEALSYDFKETILWALTLRNEYMMRLNPQVIMVRAAIHPDRVEFNKANPGLFSMINSKVMSRADEPASQLTYYLYKKGSKSSVPNVLKRNWAKRLESASAYEMAKYKNTGVGMIDTIRICHAKGTAIDELMKTGSVSVDETQKTWEAMRSAKSSWKEILEKCNVPHMALLRNLRGIFTEIEDTETRDMVLKKLKDGVLRGKQFPFRYWSAYKAIKNADNIHFKQMILDTLEECIDISCANMPTLKGKTMCLSDNSGSAWGTLNSEYGSVTVAEIDNLSSVIAAHNSDEGYVGKFGDELEIYPVSKRNGVLTQTKNITKDRYDDVGGATENGIWLFFEKAIREKEHWDNIFIFSDQQAGHGGLFGTAKGRTQYKEAGFDNHGFYIDVAKLIAKYRSEINPKVNVFSIQTAGYNNAVIPEYGYRTNLLYGWTGKETIFADKMIHLWDEMENVRGEKA